MPPWKNATFGGLLSTRDTGDVTRAKRTMGQGEWKPV